MLLERRKKPTNNFFMSFIQVPIGKGITKFPKFKTAQPEEGFPKTLDTAKSNLQFLHDLAENNQIVSGTDSATTATDVIDFQAPEGTTLYVINFMFANSHGTDEQQFRIIRARGNSETRLYEFIVGADSTVIPDTPILNFVGGDSRLILQTESAVSVSFVNFTGWTENTKRIA